MDKQFKDFLKKRKVLTKFNKNIKDIKVEGSVIYNDADRPKGDFKTMKDYFKSTPKQHWLWNAWLFDKTLDEEYWYDYAQEWENLIREEE